MNENKIIKEGRFLMKRNNSLGIPEEMGLYFLHDCNKQVVYIGIANKIGRRIIQHCSIKENIFTDFKPFHYVSYILIDDLKTIKMLESCLVKIFRPIFNLKQGRIKRNFPMSIKEKKQTIKEVFG